MDRPLFVKREGGDFPYPQKGKWACPNPRSCRFPHFWKKPAWPLRTAEWIIAQCAEGRGSLPIPPKGETGMTQSPIMPAPPISGKKPAWPLRTEVGRTHCAEGRGRLPIRPKGGTGMPQSPIMPAPPISGKKPAWSLSTVGFQNRYPHPWDFNSPKKFSIVENFQVFLQMMVYVHLKKKKCFL